MSSVPRGAADVRAESREDGGGSVLGVAPYAIKRAENEVQEQSRRVCN